MIPYSPLTYFHYIQPHVNDTVRFRSFLGHLNINSHSEALNLAYFSSHGVSRKTYKELEGTYS